MKTIFKLITIVLISTVFSCAKDDEMPPSLIGRWAFDKAIPYSSGVAQPAIDAPFNDPNCTKSFLEFKPNNIMSFGRYTGGTCTLVVMDERYVSDGKIIQFNQPLGPSLGTISKLTSTDLVIDTRPLGVPVSDPNNFINVTLTFKRVQ
jgi:hypothetical protein